MNWQTRLEAAIDDALLILVAVLCLLGVLFLIGMLAITIALAAPPAGADPAQAPFFKSLYSKQGLGSCCDVADCRPVPSRSPRNSPSHMWEVYIDKKTFGKTAPDDWVQVPNNMVDDETDPKLPRPPQAIACWYEYAATMFVPAGHLRCFIPPAVQD